MSLSRFSPSLRSASRAAAFRVAPSANHHRQIHGGGIRRGSARNVETLGGDPGRVTIFGQSSGARAIQYLQATPLARGLFHRAIGHSGGTFAERRYLRDPPPGGESAEAEGERWATALLDRPGAVAAGAGDVVAALRALPAERVVATVEGLLPRYAVPVDGWALLDTPYRLFAAGRQADVPILVGWNANEASTADSAGAPADATEYARRIVEEFGDAAPRFEELYPPGDDPRAAFIRGHAGVQNFGWNMRAWARAMRTVRSPAFYFYFERGPSTPGAGPTARHGAELAYVFGNLDPAQGHGEVDRDRSALMMGYWTAFAATGDPNGEGRPRWAPYTAGGDEAMVFGESVELRRGVRAKELELFDDFYAPLALAPGTVNSGARP